MRSLPPIDVEEILVSAISLGELSYGLGRGSPEDFDGISRLVDVVAITRQTRATRRRS
jgi:hypothetical protein